MEFINNFINWLDKVIWDPFMVILLLGTHIFLTLRTGIIQRKVFTGIKLSVTKDPSKDGDVSPFQALTTALASTIGTGNIVGVGYSHIHWRSWCSILVLDYWCIWYCYKVRRISYFY